MPPTNFDDDITDWSAKDDESTTSKPNNTVQFTAKERINIIS